MSTYLATQDSGGAVAVPEVMPNLAALQAQSAYAGAAEHIALAGAGFSFLPRLQLFTSNSEEVKRGKIGLAEYGIVTNKDTIKSVGKTILVVPLAWRAKAMVLKDVEKPLAYHKKDSPEFKAIREKADRDSNSGNMYGPEYLLWSPEHGFLTFFMGSKTARNASTPVRALLPKANGQLRAGILAAQFIENKDYSWHGPTISPSDQSFTYPPAGEVGELVMSFLNPVDSVVEDTTEANPEAANADR